MKSVDRTSYFQKYYLLNKEKVSLRNKLWRLKTNYNRKYREKNREKMLALDRAWRKNHPEETKLHRKRWYEKNKLLMREKHYSRTKAEKIPISPCIVCKAKKEIHRHHYDYKKPLDFICLCRIHHALLHRLSKDTFPKYNTDKKIINLIKKHESWTQDYNSTQESKSPSQVSRRVIQWDA